MTERHRRRWRRYAAGSVLQIVAALVWWSVGSNAVADIALSAIIGLTFLWTVGHAQADLAFNHDLDDGERVRWRIAFFLVPGAVAFYWHLYVR
jgi:hypothetical protein